MFSSGTLGKMAIFVGVLALLVAMNPASWRWLQDRFAPDYDGCQRDMTNWAATGKSELWPWQASICMARYGGYRH